RCRLCQGVAWGTHHVSFCAERSLLDCKFRFQSAIRSTVRPAPASEGYLTFRYVCFKSSLESVHPKNSRENQFDNDAKLLGRVAASPLPLRLSPSVGVLPLCQLSVAAAVVYRRC